MRGAAISSCQAVVSSAQTRCGSDSPQLQEVLKTLSPNTLQQNPIPDDNYLPCLAVHCSALCLSPVPSTCCSWGEAPSVL